MNKAYFHAQTEYRHWRAVAADYEEKAATPGLPDAPKSHYEAQRLAALRHATVYRALMLEMEGVNV